jgi:hypothetical protein
MFAQQIGAWFKSGVRRQEVQIGGVFRSIRKGNIIETARVLDIVPDPMGVPHVHFMVSVKSAHQDSFEAHKDSFEEHRTLGLAAFAEKFAGVLPA